jgi:hypothetical protein
MAVYFQRPDHFFEDVESALDALDEEPPTKRFDLRTPTRKLDAAEIRRLAEETKK